jgi:hypothetical protein
VRYDFSLTFPISSFGGLIGQATELAEEEMEFNPEFITRMLPRIRSVPTSPAYFPAHYALPRCETVSQPISALLEASFCSETPEGEWFELRKQPNRTMGSLLVPAEGVCFVLGRCAILLKV